MPTPSRKFFLLLALLFATFILYGMFFNAFGANARLSMAFFHIREAQQGLIMTVQSVLCLGVTLVLAVFGERMNKLGGVTAGLAVMALCSLLLGLLPLVFPEGQGYGAMVLLYAVAGIGMIAIDLLMNGVIAEVYPERRQTFLPYVHAFYGVGAMLAPMFVTFLVRPEAPATFARPYALLGGIGLAVLVPLALLTRQLTPQTIYADREALRKRTAGKPAEVFRTAKAWLFLLGTLFYLSFQTGLSAWLPAYCAETRGMGYAAGARVLSFYFLGALAMRFLSPVLYRRMTVFRFYVTTIGCSFALFLACFLLRTGPAVFVAMVLLGGFLQGGSIPSLVILCCDAFPTRTASASGIVVIAVSISALLVPAAMGWMMQTLGGAVPMLAITACLPLSVFTVFRAARKGAGRPEK